MCRKEELYFKGFLAESVAGYPQHLQVEFLFPRAVNSEDVPYVMMDTALMALEGAPYSIRAKMRDVKILVLAYDANTGLAQEAKLYVNPHYDSRGDWDYLAVDEAPIDGHSLPTELVIDGLDA